jgi:hypothetical protein
MLFELAVALTVGVVGVLLLSNYKKADKRPPPAQQPAFDFELLNPRVDTNMPTFHGVRVVEFSNTLAGPVAGRILAEFGILPKHFRFSFLLHHFVARSL